MQAFYNRSNELIAYHHQNMIMHPETLEVLGVILGNCVFDQQAKILGKFFHQKIHNLSGEILAIQSGDSLPVPAELNNVESIMEGWNILSRIKDHSCAWVLEKTTWADISLAEMMYQYQ